MRVIAGEARGRRLEALPGTEITRPTMDQVKEAMFSIVQFDLPGARVLDLYAGSGQLGIEALSRGAAEAVFVDRRPDAVRLVQALAALRDRPLPSLDEMQQAIQSLFCFGDDQPLALLQQPLNLFFHPLLHHLHSQ